MSSTNPSMRPTKVKNDPIYNRVWSLIWNNQMNATFLVLGGVGKGKSTAAIKMACDLDATFNVDRICFSIEQMLQLINNGDSFGNRLTRGKAIVLDEAAGSEEAADSRNSMSRLNKIISFFTTISRQKGLIIFYITPLLSQLDKRLRLVGVTGIIVMRGIDRRRNLSEATFQWCFASALTDTMLMPKPRFFDEDDNFTMLHTIWFRQPEDKELMSSYKKKKTEFIKASTRKWHSSIVVAREKQARGVELKHIDIAELAKKVMAVKEKVIYKGQLSRVLIADELKLSGSTANDVKQFIVGKGWLPA